MNRLSCILSLFGSIIYFYSGASCPSVTPVVTLGEGYNAFSSIDLQGNATFPAQYTLGIRQTVIRTWYYTADTDSYSGPVIISDETKNATQLTFDFCRETSTAIAAWTEDGYITARSKPAPLNEVNWLTTTTVSAFYGDQPNVFLNSAGVAFLIWREIDTFGNRMVKYSRQASPTDPWSSATLLDTDTTIELPVIAANANEDLFALWLKNGQLWGRRKSASSVTWDPAEQLSNSLDIPPAPRALVGIGGADISLFSQRVSLSSDPISISSFHNVTWQKYVHVGTGTAVTVNIVQSSGTGAIFGIKGLGQINTNTADASSGTWTPDQITLNENNQGGDPDIDANDVGTFWSIWGSTDQLSGTQVRFNGVQCPLVQISQGLSSDTKVAMNNLVNLDSLLPTRPQAHFLWISDEQYAG
jgi:hypothetical protein